MPKIKNIFIRFFKFIKTHKILLIIPIILIAIIAFFLFPRNKEEIITQKVSKGDLTQTISTNGTLESENSVKLTFLIGGKLVSLAGKEGDLIAKGSTLATLDQRTIKKNIDNALLDYSKQRNNFDQTLKDNNVSSVNDALNDTMKRTLQNNQFDLDKTVLSVDLQNLAREQSVLISPINGIITRLDVNTIGANVTPTNVFEVTNPNSLVFSMEVDEADIGKIALGQEAKVSFDAYPDETQNITIDHIDFVTHKTSTGGDAFYVKGKLNSDNANYKYRVGMNGSAEVILDKKTDILTIPLSSVFEDNKVYVKNNNKFEKREITLGAQNDTESEVIDGLDENDEVVTDPSQIK